MSTLDKNNDHLDKARLVSDAELIILNLTNTALAWVCKAPETDNIVNVLNRLQTNVTSDTSTSATVNVTSETNTSGPVEASSASINAGSVPPQPPSSTPSNRKNTKCDEK